MSKSPQIDRTLRADRILDVAKDLLLRWGYRRVTIEEVAKRAGVGKGTIYLHWRTREALFLAVGAREAGDMIDSVVASMRTDNTQISLDRYMRRYFIEAMRRPVLRAIFTRDMEMLDKLVSEPARMPIQGAKLSASHQYLGLLIDNGLLRSELRPADLDYALPTIVYGFFAMEPLLPPDFELGLEQKADQLAEVLRRAFGPATPPAEQQYSAAAAAVIDSFDNLADQYRRAAYGDVPQAPDPTEPQTGSTS